MAKRVSSIPDTNIVGALLDVWELMGSDSRTIRPEIGWSCAKFDWVVDIGLDGHVSINEAAFDGDWYNDERVQPVPLQFKSDTGPWYRESRFGCTELKHLIPSYDEDGNVVRARALAMYEHVFANVMSDDAKQVCDVVIRALSDPSLWDEDALSWKCPSNETPFACVRVRVKAAGQHPKRCYLHKIAAIADAWDTTYKTDLAEYAECTRRSKPFKSGYIDVGTGEPCIPIATQIHTKDFLVRAGNVVPILSLSDTTSKAFMSYGFSGLDHGAISYDTDAKICAASDWLVNSRRFCSLDSGKGTRLFFWGENVTKGVVDNLRELMSCGSSVDVNARGLLDVSGFVNVMEVRPNMARMSVHQVDRYRVRDLAECRLKWERDFALAGVGPFKFGQALYYWDEFDGHERCGTLCEAVRNAVVFGHELPIELCSALARVVERDSALCAKDPSLKSMGMRASWMKAYLIRECGLSIGERLMPENTNPMYRLGRMIALCDRAQYLYNGSSNIRQQFLASAAIRPQTAAADIMEKYTLYSSLVAKKNRGAFVNLDKLWGELIWSCGTDAAEMFPEFATATDKMQLYVGYYHQAHSFFDGAHKAEDVSASDSEE